MIDPTCAKNLKVLTEKHRLLLIERLCEGERTVSYLAESAGLRRDMASHHLIVLLKAGMVTTRKTGRFMYYALNPEVVRCDANGLAVI